MTSAVYRTNWSIGYVEQAYTQGLLLPFAEIRNQAGNYVPPTPQTIAAAAAQKPAITPADFSIVNQPGAGSYPITGYSWALIYTRQTDQATGQALVTVLDWLTHDGQAYAAANLYVPLPARPGSSPPPPSPASPAPPASRSPGNRRNTMRAAASLLHCKRLDFQVWLDMPGGADPAQGNPGRTRARHGLHPRPGSGRPEPRADGTQPGWLVLLGIRNHGLAPVRSADFSVPLAFTFPGRQVLAAWLCDAPVAGRTPAGLPGRRSAFPPRTAQPRVGYSWPAISCSARKTPAPSPSSSAEPPSRTPGRYTGTARWPAAGSPPALTCNPRPRLTRRALARSCRGTGLSRRPRRCCAARSARCPATGRDGSRPAPGCRPPGTLPARAAASSPCSPGTPRTGPSRPPPSSDDAISAASSAAPIPFAVTARVDVDAVLDHPRVHAPAGHRRGSHPAQHLPGRRAGRDVAVQRQLPRVERLPRRRGDLEARLPGVQARLVDRSAPAPRRRPASAGSAPRPERRAARPG